MISKRALICSYYIPQLDVDSYSRRLFHLIEYLREAGWSVTSIANNSKGADQCSLLLKSKGVPVFVGLEQYLERVLTSEHFDLALFGFWHIAEPWIELSRRVAPATRLVVDSGDLHFLRHARRILRDQDRTSESAPLDAQFIAEMGRELNVYAAADAVLAVSQKEADFVRDFVGDPDKAFAVPDCEEFAPSPVPVAERRGMFFVGNFEHLPNVEAVEFLCRDVLPQLDSSLLDEHPVYIAGNALSDSVRKLTKGVPGLRLLGWIPSVQPYLERVRLSLIPLLHGAGTKRKLIQTLCVGTPAISTQVGVEGFDVRDGDEVLIADDPVEFANSIARLLMDDLLWERLARMGRACILAEHGREVGRTRLLEAISSILARPERPLMQRVRSNRISPRQYQQVIHRTREVVCRSIPARSTVVVVSKGDEELLQFGERRGWHFPQQKGGIYAGCYPADSAEAIAQIETLRKRGGEYLVFPRTAFWWLEHYSAFTRHLTNHYSLVAGDGDSCIVFCLHQPPSPFANGAARPAETLSRVQNLVREAAAPVGDRDILRRQLLVETRNDLPTEDLSPDLMVAGWAGTTGGKSQIVVGSSRRRRTKPRISVVIPTRNRAALLDETLDSLAAQSIPLSEFEVIVVDDGSCDETHDVCRRWSSRLTLTCLRIERSGIAVAKNHGVFATTAPIVLFFDDDDLADPHLLQEHLKTHARFPLENVAVLGYTDWAAPLPVSEVMRFITHIGRHLFNYAYLKNGQRLDFTYFWGGRSSCKRSLLMECGVFRPEFEFGSEDIELGFRLAKLQVERRLLHRRFVVDQEDQQLRYYLSTVGLAVIFNRQAIQYMNRPVTYDQFCLRCERQGKSQWQFSRLYQDTLVHGWCRTPDAVERWDKAREILSDQVARVHDLEALVDSSTDESQRSVLRTELYDLYWSTFDAFNTKGIVEANVLFPAARA